MDFTYPSLPLNYRRWCDNAFILYLSVKSQQLASIALLAVFAQYKLTIIATRAAYKLTHRNGFREATT
jgi:hypothetical protein